MPQTLVIGFGNLDRGDDGVAFDVVNLLRRQMGVKPLDADETGLDDRGGETGAVFVRQLVPELAPMSRRSPGRSCALPSSPKRGCLPRSAMRCRWKGSSGWCRRSPAGRPKVS
jgi:hypothetical protein